VKAPRLTDWVRLRLTQFLADDRPSPERWMARLRELRALEKIPACSATIHLLAHLEVGEDEAESLLLHILAHRARMTQHLGRDPGLRVAAVDFLSNVDPRLTNPKIVEMSELGQGGRSVVTDALTGLHNRRFFREAIERETRRSRRYGTTLSLLLLDVDDLAGINDAHGSQVGDMALGRAGRLVRKAIREADVGCRYGEDEFAVILPETDRLGAFTVAERIRLTIEHSFGESPAGGHEVALTMSGGIACFPDDGRDIGSLLGGAGAALGLAKEAGKNRIKLYHSEQRRDLRYPTKPSAEVRLGREGDADGQTVVPINVSRTGLLVETSERYWPQDHVRVVLAGEEWATDTGGWLTSGRVARVEPVFQAPGRFRVGIALDRPVPEDCLAVQSAYARSLSATPRESSR
jgi:diguanylate cyclase (GGDEF)-like protein